MPEPSVETRIHQAMPRLTSAEARAARALLSDYPTLGLAPVAEFAGQSHASAATVLRFVAQLGFASYPDFQRKLRDELSERIKSPLDRPHGDAGGTGQAFLPRYLQRLCANLDEIGRLPQAEFEAFAEAIAGARGVHLIGGRFTDPIAAYMTAHLRILRPGVRKLEDRAASRIDQLLDVGPRDVIVILDMRRYDDELVRFAKAARDRRAKVLLITDTWISPAARYARHVLACQIDVGATWDSNTGLFAVAEAIVARASELLWDSAEARVKTKETLQGES
ncbi:MAG: MurR/RpiR family transcriptional regulator [Erythrobacter sp.]|jgi:DNA-binding MurR/RpiR family transcriptional regulator